MERADRRNSGNVGVDLDWESASVERLLSAADTDGRRVSELTFAERYLAAIVGDLTVVVWDVERRAELWRQTLDRAVTTAPAVANESVYVSTESKVLAFALESGERRWATNVTSLDLPLLPSEERLVVEDKPDSEIVCLDPKSGDRLWSHPTDHSPRGVATTEERAFVTERGEDVGFVTALSTEGGDRRWRRELEPIDVVPTIGGDVVLVATRAGTVHALERSSGKTVWTNRTTGRTGHLLPLACDDDAVYVPQNDGDRMQALSLDDGSKLWHAVTGRSDHSVAVTVDDIVLPRDGQLTVYRKGGGTTEHSATFDGDILSACPTGAGVFVAAETEVYRVD
jgi:outer membrane protein assembly factor BamB